MIVLPQVISIPLSIYIILYALYYYVYVYDNLYELIHEKLLFAYCLNVKQTLKILVFKQR